MHKSVYKHKSLLDLFLWYISFGNKSHFINTTEPSLKKKKKHQGRYRVKFCQTELDKIRQLVQYPFMEFFLNYTFNDTL